MWRRLCTNSNNNRVRRSEFAGNGSIAPGAGTPPIPAQAAIPNDFGVGLVGSSSGNIIEENGIGGNINGLALFPIGTSTPTGNLIRKNVIVGNPPMEVSAANATITPVGADIRDFSAGVEHVRGEPLHHVHGAGQPTSVSQPAAIRRAPEQRWWRRSRSRSRGRSLETEPGYPAQRREHDAAERSASRSHTGDGEELVACEVPERSGPVARAG